MRSIRKFFTGRRTSNRSTRRSRLRFEGLEGRVLMAADLGHDLIEDALDAPVAVVRDYSPPARATFAVEPAPGLESDGSIAFDRSTGVVTINGDGGEDVVTVDQVGSGRGAMIRVTTQFGSPLHTALSREEIFAVPMTLVKEIQFRGESGDDHFVNNTSIRSVVYGGDGNDVLTGGSGNDELHGNGGSDQIYAGSGNDKVYGGDGEIDFLYGQDGNDVIEGGNGNDRISGGNGSDELYGQNDNDLIEGGDGNDLIVGGSGDDVLEGNGGSDLLRGQDGNDIIHGGDGNDQLFGGNHNDEMEGGNGDDLMEGGNGDDVIDGNEGNDLLRGQDGIDVIRGSAGDDQIHGGAGNDELFGDDGSDFIFGNSGNDHLDGGKDGKNDGYFDTLTGGSGADQFVQYYEYTSKFVDTGSHDYTLWYWKALDEMTDYDESAGDSIVKHRIS